MNLEDIRVDGLNWSDTTEALDVLRQAIIMASAQCTKDFQHPSLPRYRKTAIELHGIRIKLNQAYMALERSQKLSVVTDVQATFSIH